MKALKSPAAVVLIGLCMLICAAPSVDVEDGEIELEVDGGDLIVTHRDAYVNCCLKFHSFVLVEGNSIEVLEKTIGGICCCMCFMDLTTTIFDLAPGIYDVAVWNLDRSEYFGGGEVVIPSVEGADETGLVIDYTYAQSPCKPIEPVN